MRERVPWRTGFSATAQPGELRIKLCCTSSASGPPNVVLMVDTGRPALPQTHWVLVIQTWAYVLVVAGIWFTVSPWRLRDFLAWGTANEQRIKVGCGMRLAFGLFVAGLGLTVFRSLV